MRDLLSRPASFDGSGRMDRITALVWDLLFDLARQAARFGSCPQSWAPLAAYDADEFASFTAGGTT